LRLQRYVEGSNITGYVVTCDNAHDRQLVLYAAGLGMGFQGGRRGTVTDYEEM
jgi:hypothetical protein